MDTILLRQSFNITQETLANFLGVSLRTLQGWDSRHCLPEYIYSLIQFSLQCANICYLNSPKLIHFEQYLKENNLETIFNLLTRYY